MYWRFRQNSLRLFNEFKRRRCFFRFCNRIHKLIYAEKFKNRRGKFVLKDFKLNKNPELISCRKKEIK